MGLASRGHGVLGIRSGLPTLKDQLKQGVQKRVVLARALGGIQVKAGWEVHSGSIYKAPFGYAMFGVPSDVAMVTTTERRDGLGRAESIAVMSSGTYYYDPLTPGINTLSWDDPAHSWDESGLTWDDYGTLYVHLGGTNPATTIVMAHVWLFVASRSAVFPTLGSDYLAAQGNFEEWVASAPVGWTITPAAGGGSSQETGTTYLGTSALRLTATASSAAVPVSAVISISNSTSVVGQYRRVSGFYMTDASNPSGLHANLRVGIGSNYGMEDGRDTTTGTNGLDLEAGGGEWRHFVYDFRVWDAASNIDVRVALRNSSGGSVTGGVIFDGIEVRWISRYETYQPRLGQGGGAEVQAATNDVFFGGKQVSLGTATITNGDGELDAPFAELDWEGRYVMMDLAGDDGSDGRTSISDTDRVFFGTATAAALNDAAFALSAEDIRTKLHDHPVLSSSYAPGGSIANSLIGTYKPWLFGTVSGITPGRISKTSTSNGVYEIADCTYAPNGIVAISAIYLYLDQAAADREDTSLAIELIGAGSHVTTDLATGQFTASTSLKAILLDGTNEWLSFDVGSGLVYARVWSGTPIVKTPVQLAAAVQSAMNTAASVSDIEVAWLDSDKKFRIAKSAGTLSLRTDDASAANSARPRGSSMWPTLGYATNADKTGSLSYTADTAVYVEANDLDAAVLRVNATGYKDAALGTYTGTANATIEKGPDVLHTIIYALMRLRSGLIDTGTFEAARTTASAPLAVYVKDNMPIRQLMDMLERSTYSDILVRNVAGTQGGLGMVITYQPYTEGAATGEVELFARDFISYETARGVDDVYATVRVKYAQHPSTKVWQVRTATESGPGTRYERDETREFETYLRDSADAQALAINLMNLAKVVRVRPKATVRAALLRSMVGDKAVMTRPRAGARGGALVAVRHRILGVRHLYVEGLTEVQFVQDALDT